MKDGDDGYSDGSEDYLHADKAHSDKKTHTGAGDEGVQIDSEPEWRIGALAEEEKQQRPAIFLTGAHHARELITIQMTLYTALKLIHQATVANDEKYQNLLMQNIYYIVPIVNPDGVNLIE